MYFPIKILLFRKQEDNAKFVNWTSRFAESHIGEVAEWFKAAVLKTAEVKASVGSNPTLSAIIDTKI